MSKCTNCRKAEVLDTTWDKISRWLFMRLFPQQIIDISQEKYTQGFSDGYFIGMKHVQQNNGQKVQKVF